MDHGDSPIEYVPEEIWHRIFSFADYRSLNCAAGVCRSFRSLAAGAKERLGSFAHVAMGPDVGECLAELDEGVRKSSLVDANTCGFLFATVQHGTAFPVQSDEDQQLTRRVEALLPPSACVVGCAATGVLGLRGGTPLELDDPGDAGQDEALSLSLFDLPPGVRLSPFHVSAKALELSARHADEPDWAKRLAEDPAQASPALDPSRRYSAIIALFCLGGREQRAVQAFVDGLQSAYPGAVVVGGATQKGLPLFVRAARSPLRVHRDGVCGVAVEVAPGSPAPVLAAVSQGLAKEGPPYAVASVHRGTAVHELRELSPERAPAGTARDVLIQLLSAARNADPPRIIRNAMFMSVSGEATPAEGHTPEPIRQAYPNGALDAGVEVKEGDFVQFYALTPASSESDCEQRLRSLLAPPPPPPFPGGPPPAPPRPPHVAADAGGPPLRVLGGLLFTCNGRGSAHYGRRHVDSATFARVLPGAGLAGMFCAGELGPQARSGCLPSHHAMRDAGTSTLQGFTSVYALFAAPAAPQ